MNRLAIILAGLGLSAFFLGWAPAKAEWASVLMPSGRIYGDLYIPTESSAKKFQSQSGSIWLQIDPQADESFGARVIYQLDYFDVQQSRVSAGKTENGFRSQLREGYFSFSTDGFDVRGGKQIIPWGKSDAINPTDFLTGKDLSVLNPDEEVRRTGAWALQATWVPESGTSPWSVTGIWIPLFAQGRMLIDASRFSSNVVIGGVQEPTTQLSNSEIATKLAYNGDGWDASFSFFSGWDHRPHFEEKVRVMVGLTPMVQVAQTFRRINAVGADGSWAGEKWVLRFESAYVQTENYDGQFTIVTPSHWDTVIGAERPLGDRFRIQAQLVSRVYPKFKRPEEVSWGDAISTAINQSVSQANALMLGYQDPFYPSGTLRIAYTNDEDHWEAEVFYLQNFVGSDYLLRPKIAISATDNLKISLGADLYNGPNDRPLGALKSLSSVFTEVKYTF
ncbi:MAG: hypothetical protein IT289_10045 [Oligoflexia bacterium]|nr:hypothetical protein [Oligoflexia bacterium]